VNPYALLIAGGVLLSSLAGAYVMGRSHGAESERDKNTSAVLKAEQTYRAEEARKVIAVSEIANAYANKARINAAAAASAASAADGLRVALESARAAPADSPASAGVDAARLAGVVASLLAESGSLLAAGKASGDRLAAQVEALQRDRREVCGVK